MPENDQTDAPARPDPLDVDWLLLLVVGAGLRAEHHDRPLAYRLRERILAWQDEFLDTRPLVPLLCTDVWYLNDETLRRRPVICLGDPESNAATAFHARRLPTAFVIDETLRVQLDPEYIEQAACLWGVNPSATVAAVDLFAERYLDGYLRAVHAWPPELQP